MTTASKIACLLNFDESRLGNAEGIIGVDEVGRGCLAGPVVAGAVFLSKHLFSQEEIFARLEGINDSKTLTSQKRQRVIENVQVLEEKELIIVSTGRASVDEIDRYNILGATRIAMRRAIEGLPVKLSQFPLLLDGKPMKKLEITHEGIVKGDSKSLAIALASIFAKEERDLLMKQWSRHYPAYQWDSNAGYGTKSHVAALHEVGPVKLHRALFLRKIFSNKPE